MISVNRSILIILILLTAFLTYFYLDQPVSKDPWIEEFDGKADKQLNLQKVDKEVAQWQTKGAYVFPKEGLSVLENDALILDPRNLSNQTASLSQEVDIPAYGDYEVNLLARNAAVLAGEPVFYWKEYCAESNVTVTVEAVKKNLETRKSKLISYEKEEISVEISKLAGEKAVISAEVRPGKKGCGTVRTSLVFVKYFALE